MWNRSRPSKALVMKAFHAAQAEEAKEQRISKIATEIRLASLRKMLEPSRIIRETSLLVPFDPLIIRPKTAPPLGTIFCAPRLLLDEVTRYLSWEEQTWRQRRIEETERDILAPVIRWQMWEEQGVINGIHSAFTQDLVKQLAGALQLPTRYLMGEPPPSHRMKPADGRGDKKDDG